MRFASDEVQNLVGFVPSRMGERAAKRPGDVRAEKIHTVLERKFRPSFPMRRKC